MNSILLHIPHSGNIVPSFFWKNITIEKEKVVDFIKAITDTRTNELFGNNKYKKVIFKINRVVCDVEKFLDDSKEIMSQFGMGYVYTKTNKCETFLKPDEKYKQKIVKRYYLPFHKKFDKTSLKMLKNDKKVIMIDCHSFSKEIIMFKDKLDNLPDICIGYNEDFNETLIKTIKNYFSELGYNIKENYPYEGSMVPDVLLSSPNKNFYCVMLEINKRIYINSDNFAKLQAELNELFSKLETLKLS